MIFAILNKGENKTIYVYLLSKSFSEWSSDDTDDAGYWKRFNGTDDGTDDWGFLRSFNGTDDGGYPKSFCLINKHTFLVLHFL